MAMPMKQCCASGSLHTGVPTGKVGKVHGLDCYIAEPPNGSSKGIIVIIPDAFGWELSNNRILADEYAKKGNFTVYLPDFMNGYVLPVELFISLKALLATGFVAQLYKFHHAVYAFWWFLPWMYSVRRSVAEPRVISFMKAVRNNEATNSPVGAAGFCWGGQYVALLCSDKTKSDSGKRLVDCGYTAHPSFLTYPDDIEKIVLPLSIAASEHDMQMSVEQAQQTKSILTAKTAKTKDQGIEHEFVMYDGAHHGFAVRADEEDKHEAECGKKAEAQAISWFGKWFAHPPP